MNGNLYQKIERDNALGACVHNLHNVIALLRAVRHYDGIHQFNLELPSEQQLIDAIHRCASIHKQTLEPTR